MKNFQAQSERLDLCLVDHTACFRSSASQALLARLMSCELSHQLVTLWCAVGVQSMKCIYWF